MKKITNIIGKNGMKNLYYIFMTVLMILLLGLAIKEFNMTSFFNDIEAKSYDIRVKLFKDKAMPNPNIILVSVDDDSIEKMEKEYGRWPWTRQAYNDLIEYLEQNKINLVAFDMMFIGYQQNFESKDIELAKTIAKYDNVFTSMNFDYRDHSELPYLPDKFKANLTNNSDTIDFSKTEFTSVRPIIKEIIESTDNIGFINFVRDDDGISRRAPTFLKFKGDYYPYLALKTAQYYLMKKGELKTKNYIIDNQNRLILGEKKIHLDNDGFMILNWYGAKDFETIPAWKIFKSMEAVKEGKKPIIDGSIFKDKLIFVGVTATSLYDIKSVPIASVYPGVEVQTTFLNNIIDNNSIERVEPETDFLLTILLIIATGFIMVRMNSIFISSFAVILLGLVYFIFAGFALGYSNYWLGTTYQILSMAATFTIMYIIKYINKSKDFEHTYKLATTDGLTELYNHRYFQENMASHIETCKRYNSNFSLLLIDIDFFKKFNDTYGHQAGDAVLRQVATMLKKAVRSSDVVCRYGGEEMTIILTNTGLDEAITTAQKICEKVAEKPFRLSESVEKHVTISIGVATYPLNGETPAEIIEFADQGLYLAKENGRNQVGQVKEVKPL
ncbi:MAG: diguanylate cyclase [Candidatus Gastranaerophilaceae bacterium]|jgi:diguanylate cyclase (GGDEF)-like protein